MQLEAEDRNYMTGDSGLEGDLATLHKLGQVDAGQWDTGEREVEKWGRRSCWD